MAKITDTPTGTTDTNTTVNSEAPLVENSTPSATAASATPAATADDTVNMSDLEGIRYTGRASSRSITVEDFKGVNIEAKQDLVWDASNGFLVPTDQFNAATRDYLVKDGEFELVKKA